MSASSSKIRIVTESDAAISTATTLFRHRGSLQVTVIVKARFAIVPEGVATIEPAPGIVLRDKHYDRSSFRSVGVAADLAPRLPRAQVTLIGHAYAPPGELVLAGAVRLVVAREATVLEKIIHVLGDVVDGARRPFQKMRLAYERAVFSDDNPVGILAESGPPNLVHPGDPTRPAAFGPIARYWPARRELLKTFDRGQLEREIPEFPEDFDWSYFQAAPADQRLDALFGDEWILLDGMHPALPRVRSRLPSAKATARVAVEGEEAISLDLALDSVAIDSDLQSFDLVWRASAPLGIEETELDRVTITAGLALPDLAAADTTTSDEAPILEHEPEDKPARTWPAPPVAPRFNAPPLDPPSGTGISRTVAPVESFATVGDVIEDTITSVDAVFVFPFTTPDLPEAAPLPVLAAIPPRARPAIPVVNLSRTTAVTVPWQVRPPQSSLTLVVKGTFDLVPDGAAASREESEFPTGEINASGSLESSVSYPSDFAIFKPRADVTLTGTAHAPTGSAPFMAVTFQFGSEGNAFARRLIVFGDRQWKKGLFGSSKTDPAPFTAMPLTYENAFGGRGFESNPVGTGLSGTAVSGEPLRLPNLEDPSHLIMSDGETPRPAGFGPIPAAWKERRARLGTYDKGWLKTRWPYFPEDFDWGYYQSAPATQQLAYLRGDEPFEIAGTHADRPSLRGALPGLRMRGFAQRTSAAGGQILEIPLHLDTVHFDTDAGTVSLVWRGLIEVSDEEAPELAAFLVLDEALTDAPISAAEAQTRLLAALTPMEPVVVEPVAEAAPANDDAPIPVTDPEEIAADERLEALLVATEQKRIEILRGAGVPEAEIHAPPPEPPPPDPMAVAESLRVAGASEEDIADYLRAMEPDTDAPEKEKESLRARGRARAVALLADRAPFEGEDLGEADLTGLDFTGISLAGGVFDGADFQRSLFTGASLAGAQLGRADFTGAILDGVDFEGADLTAARLTGASLIGACLEGANLAEVSAVAAIFRGAKGESASFVGGDFTRADFTGANLPSADFTAARLDGAVFARLVAPEIALFDAVGEGVVFNDAEIPRARANGVRLLGGSFRRLAAPRSIWEGAMLDRATFFGADLEGAAFNRASCVGTIFSAAELDSAHFLRTLLKEAQFLKADAMMASFRSSDLTGADLRGSNLHGADTYGATMTGANLELAIVTQSLLEMDR